jgi:hypothetical protein
MEEWTSPQALSAIAALIVAIVTSLVQFLKDRRSAPIDRKSAEMATTTAITAASKTTIEAAILINEKLAADNDRIDEDFRDEIRKVRAWERWYAALSAAWDEIRQQVHPPEKPDFDEDAE